MSAGPQPEAPDDEGGAAPCQPATAALVRPPSVSLTPPTLEDVFAAVVEEFQPVGAIEAAWCRDIAINIDYATRLRKIRQDFLSMAQSAVLEDAFAKAAQLAHPASPAHQKERIATSQAAVIIKGQRNPATRETNGYLEARAALSSVGFSLTTLTAAAYFDNMTKMEALERLIVVTDARRDSIIRDFDKRRLTIRPF